MLCALVQDRVPPCYMPYHLHCSKAQPRCPNCADVETVFVTPALFPSPVSPLAASGRCELDGCPECVCAAPPALLPSPTAPLAAPGRCASCGDYYRTCVRVCTRATVSCRDYDYGRPCTCVRWSAPAQPFAAETTTTPEPAHALVGLHSHNR